MNATLYVLSLALFGAAGAFSGSVAVFAFGVAVLVALQGVCEAIKK